VRQKMKSGPEMSEDENAALFPNNTHQNHLVVDYWIVMTVTPMHASILKPMMKNLERCSIK